MKFLLKNRIFFYIAIIFLAILIVFAFRKDENNKKEAVFFMAKPFNVFFSGVGYWFDEKIDFVSSIGSLKNENVKLFEDNLSLQSKLAELKEVEKENEDLRKQLELSPRNKFELESALVVGKDLNQSKEIVYINKGRKDGVEMGMPVIVNEGVLIGKISATFNSSSELELISNQEIKINAEIQESEARGIVHGEYGTAIVMDMIPQTIEINSGNTIITSGVGSGMPRGLLIGYVKDVSPTPDRLFQKTSLALPVSIEKIRAVSVIKTVK